MFRNYLLMTYRTIRKHKVFSFINIAGLTLGMAVFLLILLWIRHEAGYDAFQKNRKEIAHVYSETQYSDGRSQTFYGSYYPLAKAVREECPEVKEAARFTTTTGVVIKYGDRISSSDRVGFADPGFFKIFTFPFLQGDPKFALAERFSTVLTESMAKKLFGSEDPLGKILNVNDTLDIQVTGIIADIPLQSSLQFDCVVPFILSFPPEFKEPEHWGGNPFQTYTLLYKGSKFSDVANKITEIAEKHSPGSVGTEIQFFLFPFSRMHLFSPDQGNLIQIIAIFSIIALFVLLIACLNFMNLSTAKAFTRAKEVGVRKAVGARKGDLVSQFIGESILLSLITLIFSLLLLALFLPTFNALMQKQLSLLELLNPAVIAGFLGVALLTGFFSGTYPALFLSSIQPSNIFRGKIQAGLKSTTFRKTLVVVQFSLSIFMIFSTLVINRQMHFIRTKDLGFERENLLIIPSTSEELRSHYESLKTDLLRDPGILSITQGLQGPWNIGSTVGALDWDGKNPEDKVLMHWDYVDFDYFKTFGMVLKEGRAFSREYATDKGQAYIINEEAAKLMGMESPVGQRLSVFRKEGQIIGVLKNFHFQPLHNKIKPFFFTMQPLWGSNIFMRITPDNIAGVREYVEGTIKGIDPNFNTRQIFFDDLLKDYIYTDEKQLGRVSGYFTFLAILISCLGLFGLTSFMTERRTKEIGIRRVMGASIFGMVFMLTKNFTKWVAVSNIIAWPAAYFVMERIMSRYAYRAGIGIEIFLLSGIIALVIAMFTVSLQTVRAARANPAQSLRYE
ncbi:ABC transporter permease [Acidobacteriota bacterium]